MEKGEFRIRVVQMDNIRGLLYTRRIDRILNVRVKKLYRGRRGLKKGLMKASYDGSDMWRGCRGIVYSLCSLCRRVCM